MTEADWLACSDPQVMQTFLHRSATGSDRKFRLFACACARYRWPGLVEDEYRQAVEVAERCADGLADRERLRAAASNIWDMLWGPVHGEPDDASTGNVARTVTLGGKAVQDFAFSSDGRQRVVVSNEETVRAWDTRTWEEAPALAWGVGKLKCLAFSPDGTRAACGGHRGAIVVWDVG